MSEQLITPDAFWIGSAHAFDLHEAYLDFRRGFMLDALPARASVRLSADSRYKLWVNGIFVARGPARSYPQAQAIDEHEVTGLLNAGANVIAVQVYQPGYSHFAYVHRGAAGLIAQVVCDGIAVLSTDASWHVKRDASFGSLVERVSIYGSGVEERDLARDEAWQALEFDDAEWDTPRIFAPLEGYPWTGMEARALPYLTEREQPLTVLETRVGATLGERDPHLNLRAGWMAASRKPLAAGADGWYRVSLMANESAYWLCDLGRDFIGQGWVEVEGAAGRETVAISYQEKVRNGEPVISDPQTYCRVRLTDRFRLRQGKQVAEAFALRGGRYLVFQVSGPAQGLRLQFHARVSEYPLTVSKPLVTGDAELDAIAAMCETTMRACLQDGFMDSVWRESSQWVGDALPEALLLWSMTEDVRPLKRVIEMAVQGAYPDDVLPSVLPGEVHAYAIVDYNFMWVELVKVYWTLTHDHELVERVWVPLVKMLDRFDLDRASDGLLRSQPGRRLFLDWSPQSRKEPSAVYNLHYVLALRTAAELAREFGKDVDAADWAQRASALQAEARNAFWQDGCWYDDRERTTFSELAAALAILTGTATADARPALLDAMAARSLDLDDAPQAGTMVLASPFMHHYVFEALRAHGRNDQVVEIIRRRWGRWAKAGEPTTWENWNVDFPDGSQCHAFSAHPRYHLAQIFAEEKHG